MPGEETCLSPGASAKRRIEFTLGRAAAHAAINELGEGLDAPILRLLNSRAPKWPEGIIGSIAHTDTIGVAAAGFAATVKAIGLDIETIGRADPEIASRVASTEERIWIESNSEDSASRLITLFSAKECVFKALHPEVQSWIGFLDVEFMPGADGLLRGALKKSFGDVFPAGFSFEVGYQIENGAVLTWLALGMGSSSK
jgi:4'-phosphopantetheinyl transferase EntD